MCQYAYALLTHAQHALLIVLHLTCRNDTHVPAPTHRNTMMQNIQKIIAMPRDLAWTQVAANPHRSNLQTVA